MTFNKALVIIGIVLMLHALGIFFDLYGIWQWYDIPLHFGGGFAAGALGLAIWNEGIEDVRFKGWMAKHLKWWLVPVFVMGIVAIISIGWEFHEFIIDEIFQDEKLRQLSVRDTMADFAFDLAGGTVAIALFYRIKSLATAG